MNYSLALALGLIPISCSPLLANARGHHHAGGHHLGLVGQICTELIQNQTTCTDLVKAADPKIAQAKTFQELAQAVLEFAVNKGIEGQTFLKGLALIEQSPAIKECANFFYDGVVGSFRSALRELKEDAQTASYDAKAAYDGPDGCNRALAAENINNPAITALNGEIALLSQIAFETICKYSN
uniref:Uncharacterized protein n=1 Tax=Glycine max TaxID=3847 RepID=C6SVY6_SOYBN|nr:unknown [Glycine max]